MCGACIIALSVISASCICCCSFFSTWSRTHSTLASFVVEAATSTLVGGGIGLELG